MVAGVESVASGDHARLQPAPGARSGGGPQRTSRGGQLVGVKRLVVAHDEHVHITAAGHEAPERSGAVEICRDQARDHLAERDIETPDQLDHRAHGVRQPRCNDISTPAIPYRRLEGAQDNHVDQTAALRIRRVGPAIRHGRCRDGILQNR
jgi:hypothetical protein